MDAYAYVIFSFRAGIQYDTYYYEQIQSVDCSLEYRIYLHMLNGNPTLDISTTSEGHKIRRIEYDYTDNDNYTIHMYYWEIGAGALCENYVKKENGIFTNTYEMLSNTVTEKDYYKSVVFDEPVVLTYESFSCEFACGIESKLNSNGSYTYVNRTPDIMGEYYITAKQAEEAYGKTTCDTLGNEIYYTYFGSDSMMLAYQSNLKIKDINNASSYLKNVMDNIIASYNVACIEKGTQLTGAFNSNINGVFGSTYEY